MDQQGRLVGMLFENLGETQWAADFRRGVCAATRSHAAAVFSVDFLNGRHELPAYVGQGREAAQAFEQTHATDNPWSPAGGPAHPAGSVVVPDDTLPLAALRRTAFWSDFLRRMDVDHGVGVIGLRTPERAVSLTLLRSSKVGIYDANERGWLAELARHWVNACRLRDRLTTPDRDGAESTRTLDLLSVAAFFLDAAGHCRRWNAAGEALLRDGGLVRLQSGRLVSSCPGSGPAILGSGGPRVLRQRDGRVAGHATVQALPGHGPLGAARAVVFIDLLGLSRPAALQDALVAAYGLTVREAELVARLAEGMDLPTVAKSMGLGGAAARTRLKIVFQKMEVSGQGELVVAVAGLRRALGRHPRR